MIEKKTVVDQIEITRDGTVQVRFGFLLVEDGEEIDCKWHRTAIAPDAQADDQFAAVNAHLKLMGKEQVAVGDVSRVRDFCKLAHTGDVVKKYKHDKQSRANAEAALIAIAEKK